MSFLRRLIEEYIRLAEIGNKLRLIFELWGYREVIFPSIEEYSQEIRKGTKFAYDNEFYLINPDVTSRIIKNFDDGKAKLFYVAEVLNGGVKGEWQAGVEYIGGDPDAMILEVLSVIVTSLESLGIQKFYIDLGSIEVWKNSSGEHWEKVKEALIRRNFERIESLPIPQDKKDELWRLFNFRGRESGYERLDRLIKALGDERVFIDFATVRPLPYYTDVIFEVYSPSLGKPIGGGGEYEVKGKTGVGFVFYLDRLAKLYRPKERSRQVISSKDLRKAYALAREMVKLGIPVEVRL
ncbi:ATP phosphoribosyltransferase regulatory subunit [Pyrococcus kukulkanii]|uniref:ATP phosphoribosyltransferase regulatory subunit n=1 Tax=Pyrococcus kukulkanii TaxID=1609559 RepID=UPI003562F5A4